MYGKQARMSGKEVQLLQAEPEANGQPVTMPAGPGDKRAKRAGPAGPASPALDPRPQSAPAPSGTTPSPRPSKANPLGRKGHPRNQCPRGSRQYPGRGEMELPMEMFWYQIRISQRYHVEGTHR